jgi:cell division transport system permease protein
MALQLDYVVRETSTNLRRNVTLSFAAVVTIAVSLTLFGTAMVLRAAVGNLSTRWSEDVKVIVFVKRDISQHDKDTLEAQIKEHPDVKSVRYMDSDASMKEFKKLFRGNPAMLEEGDKNPDLVPNSFRVTPNKGSPTAIRAMTDQFATKPGVLKAKSALDGVTRLQHFSSLIQTGILVVSLGLLAAALMLILNAIRMAMFARRREIEVMKLVGATNWFIRIPFMLEGVVQGLAGSLFAVAGVYVFDKLTYNVGSGSNNLSVFTGMIASRSEVTLVMLLVVFLGIIIGAVGSGWALSRFLKV